MTLEELYSDLIAYIQREPRSETEIFRYVTMNNTIMENHTIKSQKKLKTILNILVEQGRIFTIKPNTIIGSVYFSSKVELDQFSNNFKTNDELIISTLERVNKPITPKNLYTKLHQNQKFYIPVANVTSLSSKLSALVKDNKIRVLKTRKGQLKINYYYHPATNYK